MKIKTTFSTFCTLFKKKKDKNIMQTQKMFCAVYGGSIVNDWTCQKSIPMFHLEDMSLDKARHLGKTAEVNSDEIRT